MKNILTSIANGTIYYPDRQERISDIGWEKHPKFKGVYLKHVVTGANTNGLFSSHLVKVDPNCRLEPHCHVDEIELHEIIDGYGSYQIMNDTFDYHLGKMALIPKGKEHMVIAGEKGLSIMAKFFPAIV